MGLDLYCEDETVHIREETCKQLIALCEYANKNKKRIDFC